MENGNDSENSSGKYPPPTVLPKIEEKPNELSNLTAPDQFVALFHKEIGNIGKLDDLLKSVEEKLLSEENISIQDSDGLLVIYNTVQKRRDSSQNFTLRVLEMAVRAKFSDRLLGLITGATTPDKTIPETTNPKIREIKDLIREEVDRRVTEK